ncbi:MAG: DUF1343 domain-containing protein [Acidobacteria bacterium]|nr:DUF1343 domain-containing protein [Acidobacteriota bacterium]
MTVKPGIEILIRDGCGFLKGARVGAVVHPASVLPDLRPTADALSEAGGVRLVSLFGPQHGARGEMQDNMVESQFYRDPDTGLPVHSLYGETRRPTEEMMRDMDALVFDLQDVGTRVYTFIHTMAYCMKACAAFGKKMVVLDRPNPIGGDRVEGNLPVPEFRSFVGLYPIPMRHGMTVGELALLYNSEYGIDCDLSVIAMEGWKRCRWFDQTGLPWIQPSPNLPTLDTAAVYPGTVLFEGTQNSEGRGTTRPFELVGAPFIKSRQYADYCNRLGLPGVYFRPAYFRPTFHKFARDLCGGAQIHVTDRGSFEPYLTGIASIAAVRFLYPEFFKWRDPPYEYEFDKRPIEILCGCREIPDMIENGVSPERIRQSWQSDVDAFRRLREPYLLYE